MVHRAGSQLLRGHGHSWRARELQRGAAETERVVVQFASMVRAWSRGARGIFSIGTLAKNRYVVFVCVCVFRPAGAMEFAAVLCMLCDVVAVWVGISAHMYMSEVPAMPRMLGPGARDPRPCRLLAQGCAGQRIAGECCRDSRLGRSMPITGTVAIALGWPSDRRLQSSGFEGGASCVFLR